MALTQKQENFCLEYIKTGNASEAYRRAYDAKKMKSETITNNASKLLTNSDISARVQGLRAMATKNAIMTVEQRKELLTKIAHNVTFDKDGNAGYTDALKAIDLVNKMDGLYTVKQDATEPQQLNIQISVEE